MTTTKGPRRILSGVQPSGKLHLGNYFGAIKQHLALQHEAETFYFIADYHALTTVHDRAPLQECTTWLWFTWALARPPRPPFANRTCLKSPS